MDGEYNSVCSFIFYDEGLLRRAGDHLFSKFKAMR